jgi:hypothetical protein
MKHDSDFFSCRKKLHTKHTLKTEEDASKSEPMLADKTVNYKSKWDKQVNERENLKNEAKKSFNGSFNDRLPMSAALSLAVVVVFISSKIKNEKKLHKRLP